MANVSCGMLVNSLPVRSSTWVPASRRCGTWERFALRHRTDSLPLFHLHSHKFGQSAINWPDRAAYIIRTRSDEGLRLNFVVVVVVRFEIDVDDGDDDGLQHCVSGPMEDSDVDCIIVLAVKVVAVLVAIVAN